MSEKFSYQQLQLEERLTIASLHLQGLIKYASHGSHTWALTGNYQPRVNAKQLSY